MSFASVANSSATGSGLNYPCQLIENGPNPTLNLVNTNTIYTITTDRGGNATDIYLPINARLGDWVTIVYYLDESPGDTINIQGLGFSGGTLSGITSYGSLMFVYSPIPIFAGGTGWISLSFI
jgi:hypothetical protein